MTMVVDASMAAAWVLVDEQNPAAEPILDQVEATEGSVPCLFWHEIRSIWQVFSNGSTIPSETIILIMAFSNVMAGTSPAMTAFRPQ